MVNWNDVAQAATTIGVIVAAASVVSGYVIYRASRRDLAASDLRLAIVTCKDTVLKLMSMVNDELANDIAHAAVYAQDFDLFFTDAYDRLYRDQGQADEDRQIHLKDLAENIEKMTVPLNGDLVRDYESSLMALSAAIAPHETNYPALYRVVSALRFRLRNELVIYKNAAWNRQGAWGSILQAIDSEEHAEIDSVPRLRHRFAWRLTETISGIIDNDRADIANIYLLLSLVGGAYLRMTNARLLARSRKERTIPMKPITKTGNIPEDLYEAQHALDKLLSLKEGLVFVELAGKLFPNDNFDWL